MSLKLFIILLALVLEVSFVLSGPAVKSNYIEQENSCREVCGLCDCDGFYCEDECICECSIKDEDNLQCIAEMKTECDKNGLEYELLMQETAKERFMRQIKPNLMPFEKLSKNLVIIKKKREDPPEEVSSPPPEPVTEEIRLAAPAPIPDPIPHFPGLDINLPTILRPQETRIEFPNLDDFAPSRLMNILRVSTTTQPPDTTRPPITLPPLPTMAPISFPTFPQFGQLSVPNPFEGGLIVQPPGLF